MIELVKEIRKKNKAAITLLYTVDYDSLVKHYNFNYLQVLVVQAIISRNAVSIIVFKDNEWFPYIKDNEHLYPKELLHKKEFSSQVRINITELLFKFITEDFLVKYLNDLKLFTPQEKKLISYVKEGNYKKIVVLFKSKKQVPLEVVKNKEALLEILKVLQENDYREFIVIDKENKEFRIRDEAKTNSLEKDEETLEKDKKSDRKTKKELEARNSINKRLKNT